MEVSQIHSRTGVSKCKTVYLLLLDGYTLFMLQLPYLFDGDLKFTESKAVSYVIESSTQHVCIIILIHTDPALYC